jgi:hypothetical protein
MQLPPQVGSTAILAWILVGLSDRRASIALCHRSIVDQVFYSYDKARQIKEKQDAYCSAALTGQWAGLGEFPEDFQWEALVDVLRGRVRVRHLSVLVGLARKNVFLGSNPLL